MVEYYLCKFAGLFTQQLYCVLSMYSVFQIYYVLQFPMYFIIFFRTVLSHDTCEQFLNDLGPMYLLTAIIHFHYFPTNFQNFVAWCNSLKQLFFIFNKPIKDGEWWRVLFWKRKRTVCEKKKSNIQEALMMHLHKNSSRA